MRTQTVRFILHKLLKFQGFLLVLAVSLTGCGGEDKGSLRVRNNDNLNKPQDPQSKLERKFAIEAVSGLAFLSYLELHRLTDVLLNGGKAESLKTEKNCQKVTAKQEIQSAKKLTIVTRPEACRQTSGNNSDWSGEEQIEIELDHRKEVQSAKYSVLKPGIELFDRDYAPVIAEQTIQWKRVDASRFGYVHEMKLEIKAKSAKSKSFFVTIYSEGAVKTENGVITEITPQTLNFSDDLRVVANRQTQFMSGIVFAAPSAKSMICGRPIGEWVGEQTLTNVQRDIVEDPLEVRLTTAATSISAKNSKRRIELSNCGKGFAALQADLGKIVRRLQADLGRL